MPKVIRRPPLFLPLLAAYPVIFLAVANPGQVDWRVVAGVALATIVLTLLLFWLLAAFARSSTSAAVAIIIVLLMFFSYGQLASWADAYAISLRLGDNQTPNVLDSAPIIRPAMAIVWALLALLGAGLVARSHWAGKADLGRAITFASIILLGTTLVTTFAQTGEVTHERQASTAEDTAIDAEVGGKPDVYFVVLDGYARQDVLAKYYGFDNAPFLDALRGKGFRVATASSSNYNWTFLSLASTLNLGYLHEMFQSGIGADSADRSLLYEAIRNSLTARFLRDRGYRIVHLQSTWGATARNPHADEEVRCEFSVYTNEFVRALAEATWLGAFHSKAGVDLARCHLANFEALNAMGSRSGPKFVFAHFVLPHHPYLFDRDGKILRNAVVSNQFEFQKKLWEDRDSYRSQLEFVDREILRAFGGILEASRVPPIIVLVSDHGPGLIAGLQTEDHFAMRFATLGAYHLPGAPDDLLPPATSSVNLFRAILGHYFSADLPMLPDRHFMSAYSQPYAFRELPHESLREWWTRLDGVPQDQGPVMSRVSELESTNEQAH